MRHNLKIRIAKDPPHQGIVSCKTVSWGQRLKRRLFGEQGQVMIIVPGSSVEALEITEVEEVRQ